MNKLNIELTNCFGIDSLNHEFDFGKGNTFSIYARNGLMKTSFAKTFQLIQQGKKENISKPVPGERKRIGIPFFRTVAEDQPEQYPECRKAAGRGKKGTRGRTNRFSAGPFYQLKEFSVNASPPRRRRTSGGSG